MITKIQLQRDAMVLASDGKKIGTLERVVLNPITNVVTHIVVRTGGILNRKDRVVPIELVDETSNDKILLHEEAEDLRSFPELEEEHIVDEHDDIGNPSGFGLNSPPVVVGYPVLGTPTAQVQGKRIVTRIEQNIPYGTVAMKSGAAVLSLDGKHVGNMERLLAEPYMDQVTYLSISTGFLAKEIKPIPIKWVKRIGEETIRLQVDKTLIDNLIEEPVAG